MHPDDVDELVTVMNRAAARFTDRGTNARDPQAILREIVDGAVATVPGTTHAGITVLHPDGQITSTTPTTEVVARLDQAQAALREGPCVHAVDADHDQASPGTRPPASRHPGGGQHQDGRRDGDGPVMVHVADMAADDVSGRWPRFAPEALRNQVHSMLSFQLSGSRATVTALNLYADRAGAFDLAGRTTAALFADQAAIALHGAEHAADLDRAVASRDVIGQAKGILMERHHLDAEAAFAMLVEASQHTNLKLRDVADWLITESRTPAHRSTGR